VEYVYQETYKLPKGYVCPEERTKPWGTGHAILMCKDAVNTPFAVINADDFYGAGGYEKIYEGLQKGNWCMTGYLLKNTVTENGHVSRGVCTAENGKLISITEAKDCTKEQLENVCEYNAATYVFDAKAMFKALEKVGYNNNQGEKYLELSAAYVPAQNFSRGESKPSLNNTLLYVYDNTIPFSFYTSRTSITPINVIYRNSLYEQIGASTWVDPEAHADGDNRLVDTYIELDCDIMKNAFYVDVKIDSQQDFVRYNVIKPLKATEYSQRILWRNSYGGISFFDFTGAKTETRDVDITTYQKNIFGYYTDTMNELEKVYNNEIKYSVTLKSHLFENDGKYLFNDLAQSPDVWTVINHETYAIIIDNISVDETDRNNIYEATVRYHYSQHPSII
jgi:hypothetical protein